MKDFEPGVWLSLEIHLYAGIHINAERESKELSVYLNE